MQRKNQQRRAGIIVLNYLALCLFLLWPASVWAEAPTLLGNFTQGGLVFGRTEPGTRIKFNGRIVRVTESGNFIFGFGRDHPVRAKLIWIPANGKEHALDLIIKSRAYKTQRIDGLPPKMVTPSPLVMERIQRENQGISKVRLVDNPEPWYISGFILPAEGIITGIYGSQRILNGKPRRPHYGLDIANKVGTPIIASTDGRVALAENDLYYTGSTIMLDHGHGLTSVYSHLLSINVSVGQIVHQGEKIGTLGDTGRATGPHLDWRLNWFNQRLDPSLLLGPVPNH